MSAELNKRHASLAILALAFGPASAQARETPLRLATDLRQSAASKPKQPLVLLLSIQGCPFCEFVRRSYLVPMLAEGLVNAWQLGVDTQQPLRDFAGAATTARAWATLQGQRTTPTVLFLGPTGEKLAEPLVGVVSSEFYGAVLDERLNSARTARDVLAKVAP